MKLRRRRPPVTDEPRGVRIVHADGSVSECALVRDPQDRERWIATPPEGVLFDPRADHVQADYLPSEHTRIRVPLRCVAPCPRCGRTYCQDWTGGLA
jgi:hypothetical protein